MSSIIDEMCKLPSMKKLQNMPYHPQTNELVERSHQSIMQMIVKLGEDKKKPTDEVIGWNAYNATQSTLMGYNPH